MLRCFGPLGNVLTGFLALGILSQSSIAVAQISAIEDQPSSGDLDGVTFGLGDVFGETAKAQDWGNHAESWSCPYRDVSQTIGSGQTSKAMPPFGIAPDSGLMAQREENPLGDLDLDPDVIQDSPVLQDWLRELPDIADEIRNQPSFRTRFRVGYAQFPSNSQATGLYLGVEDVFVIAGSGLTAAASFSRSWNDQRESFGAEVRYYLLPLGSYVNIAPTLGYRSLETPNYTTNGVDVGFRLMMIPSRGGGADIAVGQRWVAPGNSDEVGITSIAVGYAVTPRLRLSTDLEFQNSRSGQESRLGLLLEWLM
jgi:hypothetical protein